MRWIIAALVLVALSSYASATWKPQYADLSAEEQAWYRDRQTTPQWRERVGNGYNSCCNHADTVRAKFSKNGSGWMYMLEGEAQWRAVPQDIVQPDVDTPHSLPVLFVDNTYRKLGPVCFFPGGSGT